MNIGEKIKYIRTEKKLSRAELSRKSGVSEISIRKYETGQRNPKLDSLKKIALALNINPYELIQNNELDETLSDFSNSVVLPLMNILKVNDNYSELTNNITFDQYKLFLDFLYSKYRNQLDTLDKENKLSPLDLIQLYINISSLIEKNLEEIKKR